MTKILNLDTLKEEIREVTLNGVVYKVKDASVKDYANMTDAGQQFDEKWKDSIPPLVEQMKFLVDIVAIYLPTCPKEVLDELTPYELNAIADFVRTGTLPPELVEGEVANEGKPLPKSKRIRKEK